MSAKARVVDQMSAYFQQKGWVLNRAEYIKAKDGPCSLQAISRTCGSWARMIALCRAVYPYRLIFEPLPQAPESTISPVIVTEGDPPITAAEALAKLTGVTISE